MSSGVPERQRDPYRKEQERTGWYGWVAFASVMLIVLGIFHAFIGLIAVFEEDYFEVGDSGLLVEVNYNVWGWTHIIFGVVVVCAGFALKSGATWARIVAVVVAVLSSIINLSFMYASPLWSVIMITVDFLVIYAVVAHGDRDSLEGY